MVTSEDLSLDWIDEATLLDIAKKRFKKAVEDFQLADLSSPVEPTLSIFRSGLTGKPLEDSRSTDLLVSLTKTLQNAVGLFHQDVLGSVAGWVNNGTAGGVVDLKGRSPILKDGEILAEVKMRYNTIKASDEKHVWDKLKDAANIAKNGAKSYVFQIIPKNRESYNREWRVSGRQPIRAVFCADGVTAYHIVTGKPTALVELLRVMPNITNRVLEDLLGSDKNSKMAFERSKDDIELLISTALPDRSALDSHN